VSCAPQANFCGGGIVAGGEVPRACQHPTAGGLVDARRRLPRPPRDFRREISAARFPPRDFRREISAARFPLGNCSASVARRGGIRLGRTGVKHEVIGE
jgi:hypothetical protein